MNGKKILFSIAVVLILSTTSQSQNIKDYEKYFAVCNNTGTHKSFIVLRKFLIQNKINYLVVNPNDLLTFIYNDDQVIISEDSWDDILNRFSSTPYVKAIFESFSNADAVQDAGITHFSSIEKGADLTVDLCPSVRPLDRQLFLDLVNDLGGEEKPVPVAISITGLWMNKHEKDLEWLKDLINNKEISVTWVNNSFNHRTSRTLPLKENFLLEKGTDLKFEVLQTEIKMIEEGIIPSPFFRFPGLVSDTEVFKKIIEFGLIPIGSDAWLGKNEWPKAGSIILLHGNGNEPIGIERFHKLLKEEKNNIRKNQWLLYDLRESVEDYEDTLKLPKKESIIRILD
jgi:uncharacterized protein YrzB (UPF0473 family)